MKTIGARQTGGGLHLKGFPPCIRDFLELCGQLSSVTTYYPHGVFTFHTFEEADRWMREQRKAVKRIGGPCSAGMDPALVTRQSDSIGNGTKRLPALDKPALFR